MCGRFTLSTPAEQVAATFVVADPPPLTPRFNVAPSQVVAVVGLKAGSTRRGLALLRWGLVPSWTTDPDSGPKPINARAETVLSKPTFREPFRRRRCLIPADGFYEWCKSGTKKTPCHIRLKGGGLLAFAGLWDTWTGPDGAGLATCCVITVAANELVRPIHDRMPAVIPPGDYDRWLSPSTPEAELVGLLRPYPAGEMEVLSVGPAVNSVKNDGPECQTPAACPRRDARQSLFRPVANAHL